jgi:endonuclease YncB( thermonuclease family)
LCCCLAISARAEVFNARVIAVIDGDTILVLRESGASPGGRVHRARKIKVRLAGIDAPERRQPWGKQSRESLLEMVGGKQVGIEALATDIYGRTIGMVRVDGLDVDQEQVRRGMAWAERKWRAASPHDNDPVVKSSTHAHGGTGWVRLQQEARQARRGLWRQDHPQAPWRWRKLHPYEEDRSAGHHKAAGPEPACGSKRYCSQMRSCSEARFYFSRCGLRALDGNRDGVPCERLCGGAGR